MTSRTVSTGSGYRIGEFRCPPGDRAWASENWIGDRAHVVFPGPAVGIDQTGREPFVATANEVVLYNPATTYRRHLVSPEGDHSIFVELDGAVATEVGPFRASWLPVAVGAYASLRRLNLPSAEPDPLRLDEFVFDLLRQLASGRAERQCRSAIAAVEQVKSILAARTSERLTLAEIADEVHYSPFHLARTFRAVAGQSICSYRTQLRVRLALERVHDPTVSLAAIASDLGFASHAHLTTAFRRTLGVRPIDVRRDVCSLDLGQLPTR